MKSKNGETTLADVVHSVHDLKQSVHDLTKAMNSGFAKLTREVIEVREAVGGLGKKFDRLEKRFEHSLATAGTRGLDHEARISRLEDDVSKLHGF
jgi:hypothetical protein